MAGANTRNELLHGFMDEITESASALILTAALYLAVAIELADPSDIREDGVLRAAKSNRAGAWWETAVACKLLRKRPRTRSRDRAQIRISLDAN